jgi:hypothetical protein
MNTKLASVTTAALISLAGFIFAQTQADQVSPTPTITPTPTATAPQDQQGNAQMQNMDKMATTVTRAAEMCEAMMKKEMAAKPFNVTAGVIVGLLLFIALVLFVILEVQWIIYWNRLLKRQKINSEPPP